MVAMFYKHLILIQIDWHDLSHSLCVVVHSLLWLAHGCNLLNSSSSWLKPVLSLLHWEPDISARVAFVLKVEWDIKVVLTIWEEVGKAFMEGVNFTSESVVLDRVMMVVLVVCIVNMSAKIVCGSCLVVLHKWRREVTLLWLFSAHWLL